MIYFKIYDLFPNKMETVLQKISSRYQKSTKIELTPIQNRKFKSALKEWSTFLLRVVLEVTRINYRKTVLLKDFESLISNFQTYEKHVISLNLAKELIQSVLKELNEKNFHVRKDVLKPFLGYLHLFVIKYFESPETYSTFSNQLYIDENLKQLIQNSEDDYFSNWITLYRKRESLPRVYTKFTHLISTILYRTVGVLSSISGKISHNVKTISSTHIQSATRILFPENLTFNSIAEARKEMTTFINTKKRNAYLPLASLRRLVLTFNKKKRIVSNSAIYLIAVLLYLSKTLWDNVSTLEELKNKIKGDEELSTLMKRIGM